MGTWQTLDVPEGRDDVVTAALDAGSTFVDSSPMYGEAERTLAQGLGDRRDEAFVATKLWTPDDAEARRQAKRALDFYGGRVDLYQVHNLVAVRQRLDLLERLQEEGKVGQIGATHYSPSAFDELERGHAQRPHHGDPDPVQPARARGGAAHPPARRAARPRRDRDAPARRRRLVPSAPNAQDLAPLGVETWAQALLKYVLADPRITVAIPACSKPQRVTRERRRRRAALVRERTSERSSSDSPADVAS